MSYEPGDIAKELTVALINKMGVPQTVSTEKLYNAQWVGDAYKTIYKAVTKPTEAIEKKD